jgi:hypothetical protein
MQADVYSSELSNKDFFNQLPDHRPLVSRDSRRNNNSDRMNDIFQTVNEGQLEEDELPSKPPKVVSLL